MKFEVGKYYKHEEEKIYFAVRGRVNTTMWGETLIVESPDDTVGLRPCFDERDDYKEIDEKEWLNLFVDAVDEEVD